MKSSQTNKTTRHKTDREQEIHQLKYKSKWWACRSIMMIRIENRKTKTAQTIFYFPCIVLHTGSTILALTCFPSTGISRHGTYSVGWMWYVVSWVCPLFWMDIELAVGDRHYPVPRRSKNVAKKKRRAQSKGSKRNRSIAYLTSKVVTIFLSE